MPSATLDGEHDHRDEAGAAGDVPERLVRDRARPSRRSGGDDRRPSPGSTVTGWSSASWSRWSRSWRWSPWSPVVVAVVDFAARAVDRRRRCSWSSSRRAPRSTVEEAVAVRAVVVAALVAVFVGGAAGLGGEPGEDARCRPGRRRATSGSAGGSGAARRPGSAYGGRCRARLLMASWCLWACEDPGAKVRPGFGAGKDWAQC